MHRRTLVAAIGASSASLAGCVAVRDAVGGEDLPEDCPTSQDLGVDWPRDLDESTVASFIESYELAYYQRDVIDDVFEPMSRLDTYEGWIASATDVRRLAGGWRVEFEGIVNFRRGDLYFEAAQGEPPDEADLIPATRVEDEAVSDLLQEAARYGEADERFGPGKTDAYLDRFEELDEGFELTDVHDTATLWFDVNGTAVEFVVGAAPPNRDHFWYVSYYVDEHVIYRSSDQSGDPRDGELLECRTDV